MYWALSGGDGGDDGGGARASVGAADESLFTQTFQTAGPALDAAVAGSRRTVRIPRPVPRPQCTRPSVRSSAPSDPSARSSAVRPSASSRGKTFKRTISNGGAGPGCRSL